MHIDIMKMRHVFRVMRKAELPVKSGHRDLLTYVIINSSRQIQCLPGIQYDALPPLSTAGQRLLYL